ncbi:hypothetical protein FA13DRAFT_79701 [Coprinellus micaceus]|uniref:Uncharacterized protein n=1 Tax=Coprinellus micaceus TaxID=71717 RepID=A0A4Y7TL84_COPMI|nr:hypothetical protein FA13DRAFT_79701 [Coprinellus micaceus]
MSTNHPHFALHEPKFVADLEERLLIGRHHDHRHTHAAAHPNPRLVPAIPDLRFEYSYLRSIKPYVKITRTTEVQPVRQGPSKGGSESLGVGDDDDRSYEKVQFSDKEVEEVKESGVVSLTKEVIEVQWGKVLWATTRDQLLSPLIQGALWAIASHCLTPFSWGLGSRLGSAVHDRVKAPAKEGSIVTWLRTLFTPPSAKIAR